MWGFILGTKDGLQTTYIYIWGKGVILLLPHPLFLLVAASSPFLSSPLLFSFALPLSGRVAADGTGVCPSEGIAVTILLAWGIRGGTAIREEQILL